MNRDIIESELAFLQKAVDRADEGDRYAKTLQGMLTELLRQGRATQEMRDAVEEARIQATGNFIAVTLIAKTVLRNLDRHLRESGGHLKAVK